MSCTAEWYIVKKKETVRTSRGVRRRHIQYFVRTKPHGLFLHSCKTKIYFQYEPKNRGEPIRACILRAVATCRVPRGEKGKGKKIRIRRITNNNNNSLSKTREYIIVFRRRQDGMRGEKEIKRKKRVHHFHRIRRRSFIIFERIHQPTVRCSCGHSFSHKNPNPF